MAADLNALPEALIDDLLRIANVQRKDLTNDHTMIYNEVYRITNKRTPGRGCNGICDSVWMVGRNVIKKLSLVKDVPTTTGKASVTTKTSLGGATDLNKMSRAALDKLLLEAGKNPSDYPNKAACINALR